MGIQIIRCAVAIPSIVLLLTMASTLAQEKGDAEAAQSFDEKRLGFAKDACTGPYVGKEIPLKQLRIVLDKHKAWLKDYNTRQKQLSDQAQKDFRRADLCGVDLRRAVLDEWNLSGANLAYANLSGARLPRLANLSGTSLRLANLSGAMAAYANLSGSDLTAANLSGAYLYVTTLSGAVLDQTLLSGAMMAYADLSGVRFEPNGLPRIDSIARAMYLESAFSNRKPDAFVKLRKALDDAGYHEQARKITYAIKRSEYRANPAAFPDASVFEILKKEVVGNPWKLIEDTFRYVFFDLPTQWGMNPGRAIRVLLVLIGVFSLPYIFTLRYPSTGLIFRKWGSENRPTTKGTGGRSKSKNASKGASGHVEPLQYDWPKAIGRGVQFSLISAFHIGWRDLNVGNWISRLQPRDYTLYATGWVRTVAGMQSLISVYLLAMWALTYFGRPFD